MIFGSPANAGDPKNIICIKASRNRTDYFAERAKMLNNWQRYLMSNIGSSAVIGVRG